MVLHVQGNRHQGDSRYPGQGKQCTAMAMVAVAYKKTKNMTQWMTSDVDFLLDCGDQLYTKTSALHNLTFPMPTDISEPISIHEIKFKVNIVKSLSGVFSLDLPNNDDFFTALFNAHDAAILTFGQVFSSYAVGVLKEHDGIYIFDSHSRDRMGCVYAMGLHV
ncbi:hypothetical protein RRG08_041871 [Elysia crispata]|uniref:Uncharacterized protein n=1 Tax=Elysia crispata TaxID=231223 RepID=A0AAE1CQF0_9GAST|nr:hypothetical protein RRG08_041871 [Elysia crispata]